MANELHTMPLKVERLMSSQRVRALELDEFGAYIKLLADAWLNGGYLHKQCLSNASAMQRICGCNDEQAERIQKNVIEQFFIEDENGNLINPSQVEIYEEVSQRTKIKQDRAKKGAAARWGCSSNAQAMHKQCQSKPKPKPNIYPLTSPHGVEADKQLSRFDDFWEVYPVKREKKNAEKKWKAKKLDNIADRIINDVKARQVKDRVWLDGFIPNPTTYINGERWEDEIQEQKQAAKSSSSMPDWERF